MKADQIMDAIGKVKEEYIVESAPGRKKKPHLRWIAAAIAVVLILAFFQTAPGVAALDAVKETVTSIIQTLFPPKDVPLMMEGTTEMIHQEAGGKEPVMQEDGTVATPGFAIYYDTESYKMVEENGATYIRPIQENDNYPPCEIEIKHIPDLAPADVAQTRAEEMAETWERVTEAEYLEDRGAWWFNYSAGTTWNSACGNYSFYSDGHGGTYQIKALFFMEASGGFGVRFGQMILTFEVLDPQ